MTRQRRGSVRLRKRRRAGSIIDRYDHQRQESDRLNSQFAGEAHCPRPTTSSRRRLRWTWRLQSLRSSTGHPRRGAEAARRSTSACSPPARAPDDHSQKEPDHQHRRHRRVVRGGRIAGIRQRIEGDFAAAADGRRHREREGRSTPCTGNDGMTRCSTAPVSTALGAPRKGPEHGRRDTGDQRWRRTRHPQRRRRPHAACRRSQSDDGAEDGGQNVVLDPMDRDRGHGMRVRQITRHGQPACERLVRDIAALK